STWWDGAGGPPASATARAPAAHGAAGVHAHPRPARASLAAGGAQRALRPGGDRPRQHRSAPQDARAVLQRQGVSPVATRKRSEPPPRRTPSRAGARRAGTTPRGATRPAVRRQGIVATPPAVETDAIYFESAE